MDAFLPGVGDWRNVWLMRDMWHFHFYGKTPLALVHGRERIYFEHFWNDFAADPAHSVPERDRRIYAKAYARRGGMRAGFEYFRAFEKDAEDFGRLAQTPLPMPMLVLTGEKASGDFLIQQSRLVATNVDGVVVRKSGHWLDGRGSAPSHPQTCHVSRPLIRVEGRFPEGEGSAGEVMAAALLRKHSEEVAPASGGGLAENGIAQLVARAGSSCRIPAIKTTFLVAADHTEEFLRAAIDEFVKRHRLGLGSFRITVSVMSPLRLLHNNVL